MLPGVKRIDWKNNKVGLSMLAVALLLVLGCSLLFRADTFWITDGGNKYMVLRSLLDQGTLALPAIRPGDPQGLFFPDGGFHFVRTGEGYRSIFPEYFSIASAPFYAAFGFRGLLILPLLSAVALTWILYWFCRRFSWLEGNAGLAAWALLFCSPMAFYCWTFWEMVPGMVPVLAAFFLIIAKRSRFGWAGALLGVGLLLRPEMYFVVGGLLATLLWTKRWQDAGRLLFGFFCGGIGIWGWQYWQFGHVLGIHGSRYHQHNAAQIDWGTRVWQQMTNYAYYWWSFSPGGGRLGRIVLPVLLGVATFLGCLRKDFRAHRGSRILTGVVAAFVWFLLVLRYWREPEPVMRSIFMVGVFGSLPFLLLFLLNLRALWNCSSKPIAFWTRFCVCYCVLLPPLLTANDLGIIWGARHWLAVLPVMFVLCGYAALRMRAIWLLMILGVISFGIQLGGWRALTLMTENSAKLTLALQNRTTPVILSDIYFLPEQTPELFFTKEWLYLADDRQAELFLAQEKLPERASLVVSRTNHFRSLSNHAIEKILKRYRVIGAPHIVELPGTTFLNVAIFTLRKQ